MSSDGKKKKKKQKHTRRTRSNSSSSSSDDDFDPYRYASLGRAPPHQYQRLSQQTSNPRQYSTTYQEPYLEPYPRHYVSSPIPRSHMMQQHAGPATTPNPYSMGPEQYNQQKSQGDFSGRFQPSESFPPMGSPPPYTPRQQTRNIHMEIPDMGRLSTSEQRVNQQHLERVYDSPDDEEASKERDRQMRMNTFLRDNCKQVGGGDMTMYQAKSRVTYENITKRVRRIEIGDRHPGAHEKVIMIVGATGSGKSTLINGMFNYILGVEWKDDFRVKLIEEGIQGKETNQAESQTQWITSYTIHYKADFTIKYTLTIIDTPGFGDTAGIKKDTEITDQIKTCFTTESPHGVDSLDAVGFVAQSALPRLTPSQRYIFDSILTLFGKDIGENIFMLLTFADGQKPQILSGLKAGNIPYQKFFKFNNSALFVSNKGVKLDELGAGVDDNFDEMFWKMGVKSFRIFMKELGNVQAKSLLLTKDVLDERSRLDITIEGIQKDIKLGLGKLEQLRTEYQVLDHHQADIDKNRNFTYTVVEQSIETKPTEEGQYTTNCINCNRTCHEHCMIPKDENKARCWAMGGGKKKEYCRICSQHCHWSIHRNLPYVYVIVTKTVLKTAEDLKRKYEEAEGKKLTAEQLVRKSTIEFDAVQMRVLTLINQARKSIDRLNEIALRTNPLSTVDYIDILISSEKAEARPGWKERVDQLIQVKEKAEQMQKLAKQNYDPFAVMKKQYHEERQQRQKSRLRQLFGSKK